MTHLPDLGEYTYYDTDSIGDLEYRPGYRRLTVGWLDHPHPYETGPAPDWLPDALRALLTGPRFNVMRGFHVCSLCPPGAERDPDLGNAEFRVPWKPGVMFAAPNLICHYVTAHTYRPPGVFLEALRQFDPTRSSWVSDLTRRLHPDDR